VRLTIFFAPVTYPQLLAQLVNVFGETYGKQRKIYYRRNIRIAPACGQFSSTDFLVYEALK